LLAAAAAVIYCCIWGAALYSGAHMCGSDVNPYVAMALSGMMGGLGDAAMTSLDVLPLRKPALLAATGLVGAAAALPFALYARPVDAVHLSEEQVLHVAFAVWQVAVGTYIYWVSAARSGAKSKATSSAA
jgi:hypothetical protein